MAATYDNTLPTDRDWVRFLIRDTNTTTPIFDDNEIDAVLDLKLLSITSPAARYFAAAELLSAAHTAWMTKGRGVASKKVSQLSISYGTGVGINIDAAIQARIKELRITGAHLLCPEPRTLAMI